MGAILAQVQREEQETVPLNKRDLMHEYKLRMQHWRLGFWESMEVVEGRQHNRHLMQ